MRHRLSWMHPRSKHWHQLDHIISRREHLDNIRITRAYHSANCDTDHSLVCTKVQIRPKKLHHAKHPAKLRINTAATAIPENVSHFKDILNTKLKDCQDLDINGQWNHIRDTTHSAAVQAFGKRRFKSQDWFNANIAVLQPQIAEKRNALQNYQGNRLRQAL